MPTSYQIHGRSITADNIGSLVTVSNYEALPSTRLSELWLEQHLFNDHVTVRIGQLTADTEFLLSSGGSNFLDSTWGWATLPSFNLPGGGPSYPLATPGVRVALKPNDKWSLKLGVYNGDPAGAHCTGNPQVCDDDGLDFRLDTPPLMIAEGSYKYNQNGQLPGTVKVGGWNQFGTLHNQPFGLGAPTVAMTFNSVPIESDWAIYGIVDQLVWRVPDSKVPKGIGLFARVIGAPGQQNLVDFYADGGVTFSGMMPHRADDKLGYRPRLYRHIQRRALALDVETGRPIARTYEALFEICYTAQLNPGWTLQPDFQYIWQPGGGIPEPAARERCRTRRCGEYVQLSISESYQKPEGLEMTISICVLEQFFPPPVIYLRHLNAAVAPHSLAAPDLLSHFQAWDRVAPPLGNHLALFEGRQALRAPLRACCRS